MSELDLNSQSREEAMLVVTEKRNHFEARLMLSDGAVAGEGYGPSADAAKYFAISDARGSDDSRFVTAANFQVSLRRAQAEALGRKDWWNSLESV